MLSQLNTNQNQSKWLMFLGQALYVGLLLTAMMMYFYFFTPEVYNNLRKFTFMYSLVTLFFLIGVGLNYFVAQGVYITPMMIVPILVLVFFDGRTALFVTGVLTLICAGVTAFALEFIFLQFCAGTAAVFSLRELSRRSQLLRTSVIVALAYLGAYVALDLLMNGSFDGFTWRMAAFLAVNAALTSMAYILMFAVERLFGFISVVTLVELADINAPLLMRLSNECPGTFQHSIAVSNLASDAAVRIGADVKLVRAGALYHDIGKARQPGILHRKPARREPSRCPATRAQRCNRSQPRIRRSSHGRQSRATRCNTELYPRTSRRRHGQVLLYHLLPPASRRGS